MIGRGQTQGTGFAVSRRFNATNAPDFALRWWAAYTGQQMNLSTRWWYAFAVWPALALAASLGDWSWRRRGFLDEFTYHLFGDLCLAILVMAIPFLLQRQRRRPEHLQALEAQLHPHFLFNTLNSIAT